MNVEQAVDVPVRLLQELASFIPVNEEETIAVPGNGDWTRQMVVDLKSEAQRYPGALATANLAAENAGQLVSIQEVIEKSGIAQRQIASDLGAMSKAAVRLFGRKVWPFRALDSTSGMTYLMPPEIAPWWLEG